MVTGIVTDTTMAGTVTHTDTVTATVTPTDMDIATVTDTVTDTSEEAEADGEGNEERARLSSTFPTIHFKCKSDAKDPHRNRSDVGSVFGGGFIDLGMGIGLVVR